MPPRQSLPTCYVEVRGHHLARLSNLQRAHSGLTFVRLVSACTPLKHASDYSTAPSKPSSAPLHQHLPLVLLACRSLGAYPASTAAREAPTAAPSLSASPSMKRSKFSALFSARPPDTTTRA